MFTKTRSIFLAFIFSTLFSFSAQAQDTHTCPTESTPENTNFYKNSREDFNHFYRNFDQVLQSRSANYLPIKAHIVRKSDQSGGYTKAELDVALAEVNAFYINANMQFFICGDINYIDSDELYDFYMNEEAALAAEGYAPGVINVFFVPVVREGSNYYCGYAKFPTAGTRKDLIVMDNGCANNGSTLAHELGHYFSVMHTHQTRWENVPGTGWVNRKELVDGSNCETEGDHICDTPADPNLSGKTSNCEYTGTGTDPNGATYEPDTYNVMSYSDKPCRQFFTEQQYARIAYSLKTQRNYLNCPDDEDYCPSGSRENTTAWITKIQLGQIDQSSDAGYGFDSIHHINHIGVSTTLEMGKSYPMTFGMQKNTSGTGFAFWRIFIDYNQDKVF